MATRASSKSTEAPTEASPAASTTSHVPAFARATLSGPSLGSAPLRLAGGRGPFTIMVTPAKLGCRFGRIVPLHVCAMHDPGIGSNVKGDNGAGFIHDLTTQGYVAIPHNFVPCVAFGESRVGSEPSYYLRKHEGYDGEGRSVEMFTDAWMRPRQLGHLTTWENDREGRDTFLIEALRRLVMGGRDLEPIQVEIATMPLIRRILDEARMDTAHARQMIREMVVHLPPEHMPDSIKDIAKRLEIEL